MSRLIDADALIEFCAERWIPLNIDAVNMQPTIQPEKAQLSQEGTTKDATSDTIQPEPQEGHWIMSDKRFPWNHIYKCSKCGNYLDFTGVNGGRGEANYCPNCGAKMKGE